MADMKTLTIGSETFTVVDGEAVHCCAQDLTEEQKAQARANIGAAAEGSGGGAASDPVVFSVDPTVEPLTATCNKTFEECFEQLRNKQPDVIFVVEVGGVAVELSPLHCLSWDEEALVYTFAMGVARVTVKFFPEGTITLDIE